MDFPLAFVSQRGECTHCLRYTAVSWPGTVLIHVHKVCWTWKELSECHFFVDKLQTVKRLSCLCSHRFLICFITGWGRLCSFVQYTVQVRNWKLKGKLQMCSWFTADLIVGVIFVIVIVVLNWDKVNHYLWRTTCCFGIFISAYPWLH